MSRVSCLYLVVSFHHFCILANFFGRVKDFFSSFFSTTCLLVCVSCLHTTWYLSEPQGLFLSTLVFVFLMPEFKVRNASLLVKPLLISFPEGRISNSFIKRRLRFVRVHRYLINQLTSLSICG